jgi:hypothetical protein
MYYGTERQVDDPGIALLICPSLSTTQLNMQFYNQMVFHQVVIVATPSVSVDERDQ